MEPNNESIRDRLLSRLPQPENLAAYRKEVSSLLEKNEKGLRREKWGASATWFFAVGLGTVLLTGAGMSLSTAKAAIAAYIGTFACFFLVCGAVELLKHFINRTRVELLKEIKQVQLQVLELDESMRKARA
ncbi:MAG TPA: hypothetical protein VEU96_10175 [Bryobacteraceae bacterium]|nr:hypothetical protein [Bryobacteraceae bacterium]